MKMVQFHPTGKVLIEEIAGERDEFL